MPVAVAYLSGNTLSYEPGIFKRGTIGFNLSTSLQGNYNWWNAVDQDANKLLIYSDTFSTNATSEANAIPSAWATTDLTDASLLGVVNSVPELIGQPKFTNAKDALTWLQGRGIYFIVKDGYENIVTDSLVFNLDVGWYSSYAGSGNTVKDISSTSLNGTLYNSPAFNSSNGGGLYFDGTDDYGSFGSLPLNSPLSFTNGNFSLEHWIHPTQIQSGDYFGLQNMIIVKGPASTFNYATQVSSATGLRFYHRDLNEGLSNNTFTVPNLLNKTTHVVFVINSAGTQVSLYLNGVFYQTQNLTGNPITPYANDPLLIGGLYTQQYTNFIGTIYQLRIYGKALSADEIWQNYNAQASRFGANNQYVSAGLISYLDARNTASYPGTGSIWYDLSGNGNVANLNTTYNVYTDNTYINFNTDGTYGQGAYISNFRSKLATAHTVEVLVYPRNSMPIVLAGTCGANDCWAYGEGNRFYDRTGNTNVLGGFTTFNWQKVVLVFDGSNTAVSYRNGQQVDTNTNFLMSGISNGDAYMGARGWAATANNFGLAYFRFYDRKLTVSEIVQNYYEGNIVTSNLLLNFDASNLVSYPQAGTTWFDLTSNANNGTLQNGVGFSNSNGGVLTFDGSNDQVATSINRGNLGDNMSIDAFFKYEGNSGDSYRPIIGGNDPGSGTEFFLGKNTGNNSFGVQDGNYRGDFVTNYNVFDGNWHYMCYTYNNGTGKLYLDGILRATNTFTKCNSAEQIYIGAEVQEGYWWKGQIGKVAYYTKTLSDSEVIQNFNAQKSRYGL